MTRISMCGVVGDDGRDCPGAVSPDAPINLCAKHFEEAFDWVARERGSMPTMMPEPCLLCGEHVGREYEACWVCEHCGWRQDEIPTMAAREKYHPTGIEVVYYVRFENRIKIGMSRSLRARVEALHHPELLAVERGGRMKEAERHTQFARTRIPGTEWFGPSPELDAHIRKLRAGVDDPWMQYEFWQARDAR